jgi:hypothetical protein
MKKILVGLSNNIASNKDKVRLWSESFKRHSDGDVVLIAANMNDEDKYACDELGVDFKSVEISDTFYINHKRIECIREWIKNSDADIILSTDVFDVAFQNDPFKKMDLSNFDFFVGGEGVNVNQEPWNSNNISCLFQDQFQKCADKEVICSGVMAGKKSALLNVYDRMFELCENSPNHHNIKDQAALIVMIANNEIPKIKIFNLDDGWAVHCAVAGPTQFFEGWGFKDSLKYGIPKMIDGEICTAVGVPFDIVHQFNRTPEWHQQIKEKYL